MQNVPFDKKPKWSPSIPKRELKKIINKSKKPLKKMNRNRQSSTRPSSSAFSAMDDMTSNLESTWTTMDECSDDSDEVEQMRCEAFSSLCISEDPLAHQASTVLDLSHTGQIELFEPIACSTAVNLGKELRDCDDISSVHLQTYPSFRSATSPPEKVSDVCKVRRLLFASNLPHLDTFLKEMPGTCSTPQEKRTNFFPDLDKVDIAVMENTLKPDARSETRARSFFEATEYPTLRPQPDEDMRHMLEDLGTHKGPDARSEPRAQSFLEATEYPTLRPQPDEDMRHVLEDLGTHKGLDARSETRAQSFLEATEYPILRPQPDEDMRHVLEDLGTHKVSVLEKEGEEMNVSPPLLPPPPPPPPTPSEIELKDSICSAHSFDHEKATFSHKKQTPKKATKAGRNSYTNPKKYAVGTKEWIEDPRNICPLTTVFAQAFPEIDTFSEEEEISNLEFIFRQGKIIDDICLVKDPRFQQQYEQVKQKYTA